MARTVGAAVGAILLGLLFIAAGVTFAVSEEPPAGGPNPIDQMTQSEDEPLLPGRVAFAAGFFLMGALAVGWGGYALRRAG